ncbi:MAG: alcohol dehydrogenase [Pelagibacteraceae bacterium]|nr:alcohol dehydrogenase [Pelagibacteraceae bacterium]
MKGVYLTGHGGLDKLVFKEDIPKPIPKEDEVLIKVKAAGVNNTDINTRTGWYSKKITKNTNDGGAKGFEDLNDEIGSWSGKGLSFPLIQGADVCGVIEGTGSKIDKLRIGQRVIVRTMQNNQFGMKTMGSEINGGFAEYCCARSSETFTINSNWKDEELASIPCSYSTAEGMLQKAKLSNEKILITGASGGVGSAVIQLSKLRGAKIIAQCSKEKANQIKILGADETIDRSESLLEVLGQNSIDLVVDLVGGEQWPQILEVLKPKGRYVTSGAIAGPIVELDLRTLYLKDLTFYGSTFNDVRIFRDLIGYIERNEIKPLVSKTFPLEDIKLAQKTFMEKNFIGKLVLIP